jgi:6-phosphogluconolactonase
LQEKRLLVVAADSPDQDVPRITLTPPLINQSRNIVFIVYGKDKAKAIHNVLGNADNPEKYPAQIIKPGHGKLYWYIDKEAASCLYE